MRLALAQINTTIGDFSGNLDLIIEELRKAGQKKADLVIFPELTLTGYPPKDLLDRPDFIEANLKTLERLRKNVTHPAVVIGFVDRTESDRGRLLANAAALIHQKKILGIKHKHLLPTYDVFDEGRYFEPGQSNPIMEFMGKKLGLSICEDIWTDPSFWNSRFYSHDPIAEQAKAGADYLINISASPFSRHKGQDRTRLLKKQARRYGVPLIYVNLVGGNDDLVFDGGSMVINGKGQLLKHLPIFQSHTEVFSLNRLKVQASKKLSELDEILEALQCGLRDYLEKCGFHQVVIGLSGGIDSALTAWIAAKALGPDKVLGVSMPSPYSSPGSIRDAKDLARNAGFQLIELPIHGLYEKFQEVLGLPVGKKVGLTHQNLQARIRGNLLMALSNHQNRLLLSTGNKSEMSLGYSTLYGDLAGGFAVLLDVPKTLVYRLARRASRIGPIIPPSSIRKPPSAELAPNQSDQDDLPPYDIIDGILEAYMEKSLDPKDIVKMGFSARQVEEVLRRLDQNEYKRMQAPPGIRITSKAFGYGRRVPISSRYRVKL